MRRAILVLAPLTLLSGAIFACEEDPTTGGPTPRFDGGPPPTFDASQQPFDGASPEASPDAPSTVTVTITNSGGAKQDVLVVFHDAAGAVLETKRTGADGKATSTGAVPAMVSALLATGTRRHIVTWTGVERGDELTLRDVDATSDLPLGRFDVTLPGQLANAVSYNLQASGCDHATENTSATIDLFGYCELGAKSAVLVRARNSENQLVGHSFKKGNTVPTDAGVVGVTTSPWATPSSVDVSFTNVPANTETRAQVLEIADGYAYESAYLQALTPTTVSTAKDFADALQANVSLYPASGQVQMIAKRFAPATPVAFDLSQSLPPITSATLSADDARRPVLSWTSTSTAATDGGLVRVHYFLPANASFEWTFVVAPGSTTVTAPAMPPEAESFLPASDAGSNVFGLPSVLFLETDTLPSYMEFRRQQGTFFSIGAPFDDLPTLPLNGTYRITSWIDQPG